jgi:hypothetical protein
LKKYNTPAPDIQIYKSFIGLPWGLKPLFGKLSDRVPILGYRKLPYMLLVTLGGIAGAAMVGFMPIPQTPADTIVLGIFMICLSVSINDLLTEAKYSELLNTKPKHGPDVVTFVWLGIFGWEFLGTLVQGPVLEHYGAQYLYLICLVPITLGLFPVVTNWIQDEWLDPPTRAALAEKGKHEKPEMLALVVILVISCCTVATVNLSGMSKAANAAVGVTVALVTIFSFYFLLTPPIGKLNAFTVLQGVLAISTDGATFYFFTDDEKVFPTGPNFSPWFYTTGLGLILDFCNILGIYTYSVFMKKWSYRWLYTTTNAILAVAHLWSVLIYTRQNLELGIPDKTFVLTTRAMDSITKMWMWMPGVLLTAQLCPKGSEATMFALLAGCANLGHSCAAMIGAFALEQFGVAPTGEVGDTEKFKNLWKVALTSASLPVVTLFLIPWAIPDKLQTEKVLEGRLASATYNSPYRRYMGYNDEEAAEDDELHREHAA